ncbi:hypothetical protein HRbin36_00142 [bacterium HR36]|nr:hypothetical protein HRbin36_00142 [bacterium HR36]
MRCVILRAMNLGHVMRPVAARASAGTQPDLFVLRQTVPVSGSLRLRLPEAQLVHIGSKGAAERAA